MENSQFYTPDSFPLSNTQCIERNLDKTAKNINKTFAVEFERDCFRNSEHEFLP